MSDIDEKCSELVKLIHEARNQDLSEPGTMDRVLAILHQRLDLVLELLELPRKRTQI